MTLARESYVAAQFNRLEGRFKGSVARDDFRLVALIDALRPVEGKLLLDLGCGKGRFCGRLTELVRRSSVSIFPRKCSKTQANFLAFWLPPAHCRSPTNRSTPCSRSKSSNIFNRAGFTKPFMRFSEFFDSEA